MKDGNSHSETRDFREGGNAGNDNTGNHRSIRISFTLYGETGRILFELRRRGMVRSYADCINQAILLLYKEITEQDLRVARLKTLQSHVEADESG